MKIHFSKMEIDKNGKEVLPLDRKIKNIYLNILLYPYVFFRLPKE